MKPQKAEIPYKKIIVVNDDKIQQYGKTYSWPKIIWNSLTEDVPDETIWL